MATFTPIEHFAPHHTWSGMFIAGTENSIATETACLLPALASSLVQLDMLLRMPVTDLQAICTVIKNDPALTVAVIAHARANAVESNPLPWRLADCVVELGKSDLSTVVAMTPIAMRSTMNDLANLWGQSQRLAATAECIALLFHVDPERAYLFALLHSAQPFVQAMYNADLVDETVIPAWISDVVSCRFLQNGTESELDMIVRAARSWVSICERCKSATPQALVPIARTFVRTKFPEVNGTILEELACSLALVRDGRNFSQ